MSEKKEKKEVKEKEEKKEEKKEVKEEKKEEKKGEEVKAEKKGEEEKKSHVRHQGKPFLQIEDSKQQQWVINPSFVVYGRSGGGNSKNEVNLHLKEIKDKGFEKRALQVSAEELAKELNASLAAGSKNHFVAFVDNNEVHWLFNTRFVQLGSEKGIESQLFVSGVTRLTIGLELNQLAAALNGEPIPEPVNKKPAPAAKSKPVKKEGAAKSPKPAPKKGEEKKGDDKKKGEEKKGDDKKGGSKVDEKKKKDEKKDEKKEEKKDESSGDDESSSEEEGSSDEDSSSEEESSSDDGKKK